MQGVKEIRSTHYQQLDLQFKISLLKSTRLGKVLICREPNQENCLDFKLISLIRTHQQNFIDHLLKQQFIFWESTGDPNGSSIECALPSPTSGTADPRC